MKVVAPVRRSLTTLPAELRAAAATPWGSFLVEAAILLVVLLLFARSPLLDLDPTRLQQETGEHNEAATLHIVTEQALRAGVFPLWNPYMSSGFPVAGDFVSTFWNPVTTVPIALFGGVNGYKVSAFLSFFVAGLGQLALGRVLGLGPVARLWSALLFMLSGGMALFWRLGWHQLLVGLAWFPVAFAALIWALRARRWAPLGLAAVPIFMVFTSAGGYYFLYLGVALVAITLLMVALAPPGARVGRLSRALVIALLAGGLSAVLLFPAVDVYRETVRETAGDPAQQDSQPIVYALVNYLIYDPAWLHNRSLGQANGFTWFYVGALPFVGMVGLALAPNGTRRRREALLLSLALLALYLVWHANRHTPVRHLYDAFPALYQFRFNGRLLAVATIPLLLVGGLGWQALLDAVRQRVGAGRAELQLAVGERSRTLAFPLRALPSLAVGALLFLSVWNVFEVNRSFAFEAPQSRNLNPNRAIEWLQAQDPALYNMQAGDWRIWWHWTTAAYELKQPMLNFAYNRHTRSFIGQQHPSHFVRATPRYIFPWNDSLPTTLPLIGTAGGQPVYEDPDALPYAFTVAPSRLAVQQTLVASEVTAAQARWINPNQLAVLVEEGVEGEQLVALVSDFPGWRLYIDGERVPLELVNRYLAAPVAAGSHLYLFSFEPPKFYIGLALSALTLLAVLGLLVAEPLLARRRARAAAALTDRTSKSKSKSKSGS